MADTDSNRWRRLAPLALLALAGALLLWAAWPGTPSPAPPQRSVADLVEAIAAEQPEALAEATASTRSGGVDGETLLGVLLADPRWPCRAAACRLAADRADPGWLAAVLPRASDSDWHVRAAAFRMLARFAGLPGDEPLKDTPLAQRETLLLAWLERYDASGPEQPLAGELCELYADATRVEFGRPLADRCLTCHAGAEPADWKANDACAACHPAIYAEWAGSAHAQSLSHLSLATVNPETRQVEAMDFLPVRGIGCRECHRPVSEPAEPLGAPPEERPTSCPFRFEAAAVPAGRCARCHAEPRRQWQAWLAGPQPRLATWPTGHLEANHRGDTRTCCDCHMQKEAVGRPVERIVPEHRFGARRDLGLLRRGLYVTVEPPRDGTQWHITLTNLAGHAWPTGSRRRALELAAGSDPQALVPVAMLAPRRLGRHLAGSQPPLAPGEQRRFDVTPGQPAARLFWRLVYRRNTADRGAYTAEFAAGSTPASSWSRPTQ